MKVLFLGEFSGVFSELIPALNDKGVETYLVSAGDGYKGFKSDFCTAYETRRYPLPYRLIYSLFASLLGFRGFTHFRKIWPELKNKVSGYDIVQLNNDYPLHGGYGWLINFFFVHYIVKNNRSIVLSAWGDDYIISKYIETIGANLFTSMNKKQLFKFHIKQLIQRKLLNNYIVNHISAITPGTYWYKQAYRWNSKTREIFPFAIKAERINQPLSINDDSPIIIFHGWQRGREHSKGNDILDRVIKRVVKKYGSRVKYEIVHNVSYEQYVKMFNDCHIFIDQLYADDKGMNGLLGMAAGKVVFSGFMPEALAEYPYYTGNVIGIRTYNDEQYIFERFCELIENPKAMEQISKNAIDFVVHNHIDTVVAEHYIQLWNELLEK